uniref:Uncharacterized protein n=1 Tax=Arundo donax TaxID=35708 RepID=A0A0A9AXW0_ARUDO
MDKLGGLTMQEDCLI